MQSAYEKYHIITRLKIIHLIGLNVMLAFYSLIFYLRANTGINTLYAQLIIIIMAILLTISYTSLFLPSRKKIPQSPLFVFFLLNIATSALVWSTGLLASPFIVLYVIIILITAQLYHYNWALIQMIVALIGFVFTYSATIVHILPFSSIILYMNDKILYQPAVVIFIYGLLYAVLFIFTIFSSSNSKTLLFRERSRANMDFTYQEKIIQEMPTGVIIMDSDNHILSANPAAQINFPFNNFGDDITDYLSISKINTESIFRQMSFKMESKQLTWKAYNDELIPIEISTRIIPGSTAKNDTFIIFLSKI